MAVWTFPISEEHNIYQNLTVYERRRDGVLSGWKVNPNDGYVLYDTAANDVEYDENGNEFSVTYYYTEVIMPNNTNWDNFSWAAVLRSSVDENYIFGLPDEEHEVM